MESTLNSQTLITLLCKLDIAKMVYIGIFSNFVSQNRHEIFTPQI